MRALSLLKFDLRFQFRHGFYYAYLLVSALYILVLRNLPPTWKETALTLIIFTDTSVLGFFFIGGIILLERGQKTLESLFVTPLSVHEYLLSKAVSLTLMAVLMSSLIAVLGRALPASPLAFLAEIIFSSILFIFIGIVFATRVRDVNQYLITSVLYTTVLFLPIAGYLGIFRTPLYFIFPTQGALVMLRAAFIPVPLPELIMAITTMSLWLTVSYILAYKWFNKYVIRNIGEEKWKVV